ncbi:MAG: hypothetical protein IKO83_07475 [Oscillospiraceae bacterium]|nr:hypothetical protein [Oscillospiraceae bacterium]
MTDRRDKGISFLAALCLLAFLAVFAVLNFRSFPVFCDGDVYTDMELAREMWTQKTLFPSNWVFGNQYYVIATPVLAALFYGLTGSLVKAMALATTLMGLLLLLSLAWMLRPFLPRRSQRLCALLFFTAAPMGTRLLIEPEGQLFFVLASYYACYLITLFVVFGDYVRALERPEAARPLPLLPALLLSFAAGMQSLRQTAVMVLPLLALELLALLARLLRREPLLPSSRRRALRRVCGYTAANLLGLLFIRLLHIPSQSIYEAPAEGFAARLHPLWAALRGISGLDAALYGEARPFFLLFFAAQLACLLAALLLVLRRLRAPGALERLWLLCLISLGGAMLAGLVLPLKMREIYLFLWYPLLALSLALLLARGEKAAFWLSLLTAALCLGNLVFSYGSSLRYAEEKDVSARLAFVQEAREAGIRYVYGDWYSLPYFAVWADDDFRCGFWDESTLDTVNYLNLRDIYGEEENASALYLMSRWHEAPFLQLAEERGVNVELFGRYERCPAYRADWPLMRVP